MWRYRKLGPVQGQATNPPRFRASSSVGHLARGFGSLSKMRLPLPAAAHMGDNQSRKHVVLDWTTCGVVERHTGRVSGAWVFRGTRVPVSALFANLEGGATVEEFLEWFPGVSRE